MEERSACGEIARVVPGGIKHEPWLLREEAYGSVGKNGTSAEATSSIELTSAGRVMGEPMRLAKEREASAREIGATVVVAYQLSILRLCEISRHYPGQPQASGLGDLGCPDDPL